MAYLSSFGKFLPERTVTNDELAPLLNAEASWIEEMSGIRERRWAADDESLASMAAAAGKRALDSAEYGAQRLDALIVASGSAERRFPSPAAEVQHLLGAENALALDVAMASAGALFAMAQSMLWLERLESVLVIAAEKLSPVLLRPPVEKGTAMLFGDGAGAVLITREPLPGGPSSLRLVDFVLGSDGAFAQELKLELSGPVAMNGRAVILQAARKVPAAIREVLERNGFTPAEVRHFLMHQANANLIHKIAQTLAIESSRFYSNIARYGNTSSASLLIAAAEWHAANPHLADGPVVFAAFGAGFHWGAVLALAEAR